MITFTRGGLSESEGGFSLALALSNDGRATVGRVLGVVIADPLAPAESKWAFTLHNSDIFIDPSNDAHGTLLIADNSGLRT